MWQGFSSTLRKPVRQLADTGLSEPLIIGVKGPNANLFYTILCLIDDLESGMVPICRLRAHRRIASPRGQSSLLPSLLLPSVESRVGCIALSCAPYMSTTCHLLQVPVSSSHWTTTQITINQLTLWSQENGFKFSVTNSACIHICRPRGVVPHPYLFMGNCYVQRLLDF
jgi:hypothetical protein